jgi:DNA-directed RNA polymerase subunit K/omega
MTKLASLIPPPGASKYEIAIVAAREARRLNEWSRRSGDNPTAKVTAMALERTIRGEVPYGYEEGTQ